MSPIRFLYLTLLYVLTLPASAHVTWDEPDKEFATTLTQEKAEILFTFTNDTDKDVEIIDLKSSCGCTVPELEKRVYSPGESGTIKSVFTYGSRQGRQHKRVTVTTEMDGKRALHRLSFTTEIPSWATLQPRLLRWQKGTAATPQVTKIVIADPARIHPPELIKEADAFDIEVTSEGNDTWLLTVTPKSTAEMLTEKITFTLEASEDGRTRSREFSFYGLIR